MIPPLSRRIASTDQKMETTNARPEKRHRIAAAAASAAAVPDDVLFSNILVHLPVKSLARLKCVSRSWLAAVEDPAFVRRHLELSRARPSAMIVVVPRSLPRMAV
ncbi:Os04g0385050 [Oryza sativa Japonica Group]|uniref:Os04g0385050 protein n=2 Tax=Oryza sativa subsp. japonica TaxID=39947 RepID=A0A0P0W9E0_ORYSJ|nr:Os04g0385050 [Oryza sativa Japonica Group]